MGIKLTLDGTALTKLLSEDDGTVGLEIRQCILEEFAKKHIKNLHNSNIAKTINGLATQYMEGAKNEALETLKREIGEFKQIGSSNWNKKYQVNLNPDIKTKLEDEARLAFDRIFNESIKAAEERIRETIDSRVEAYFRRAVESNIEREVDRRISDKLASIRGAL
jgi:F0F1-type ATP synthase membrane subunit b/b'